VARFEAFAQPGIVRLWLIDHEDGTPDEDGPWVEVKAEIGDRDQRKIDSALLRGAQQVTPEGGDPNTVELKLDGAGVAGVKFRTYLVAWSFMDRNDKPVKLNADSIAALKPHVADRILEKLNAYIDAQAEERASDPFKSSSERESA
jgi:hypothetical protein